MADRDWAKELAKIDKQLGSLPDEALVPAAPAAGPSRGAGPRGGAAPAPDEPPRALHGRAAKFGLAARVTLSVALGIGMLFWPYEDRCGAGLALYLGAVAVVVVGGAWSAVWSWRHRAARLHSVSLLLLLWGLVLGSLDVLPRIGYAKPDARHPATWACR